MEVELRQVWEGDLKNIYNWRNHPSVRKNSFSTGKISMEEHLRYWNSRMNDAAKHSFVIVAGGKDAGLVRLDPLKGAYEVHILVAPEMQGKGIGLAAIAAAKEGARKLGIKKLVAQVKPGNAASQAIFSKNGFSGGPAYFECEL